MRILRLLLPAVLACSALAGTADAHGRSIAPGPHEGVSVSSLTHGQMAVLAPFRSEIIRVAERRFPADETLRRLINYAKLQFTYCLWGLIPGTVTDESSPFNSCAHAYLAATRDALLRLGTVAPADAQVADLVARVDRAMLLGAGGLVLCRYSADGFNTSALIRPDWQDVLLHRPTQLSFAALFLLILAAGWWLLHPWPARRRHTGQGRQPSGGPQ